MNPQEVLLIGVFDPDGREEGFVYTVDAPTNLWVGALCDDGSRMAHEFMGYVLNSLIDEDCFNEGDFVTLANQNGTGLIATVGEEVPVDEVQALQARHAGPTVRKVTVAVVNGA